MHFFDRPSRAKIALRGSSSRPPTSEELLARARRARDQRRAHRAQHTAATHLQAAWRRRVATEHLASHLLHRPAPRDALSELLLVAGLLACPPPSAVSVAVACVHRASAHASLPPFVVRLAADLTKTTPLSSASSPPLPPPPPATLAKALAMLLALAARAPSAPPDDPALYAVAALAPLVAPPAAQAMLEWGVPHHLAALLAHHTARQAPPAVLVPFTDALAALLRDPAPYTAPLTRQLAMAVLAVPAVLPLVPWLCEPRVVRRVMHAVAADPLPFPEGTVHLDLGASFADAAPAQLAVTLSNVLQLGDAFMGKPDNDALWSFIAVLSTLIQTLPQHIVLMHHTEGTDSDEDLADYDQSTLAEDSQSLRDVIKRLSLSLKQVVSEDTVRLLLSAAVSEGRPAVVRVCQLFNFLTRREKSLNMAFQNALAFWRPSRTSNRHHILRSLWAFCLKGDDDHRTTPSSPLDISVTPLREEATPILVVFASAYSYLLYIQDAEEMFDAKWPFSVEEIRDIVLALKNYLFASLYVRPSGVASVRGSMQTANLLRREPGLLEEVSRLLSRLHLCDSRRQFRTGDDFWLAGRGSLASDSFLQDAVEAGPEALVQATEVTSFGGVRQVSYNSSRRNAVSGAGELLRVAPYLVPFSSRAKIFQTWIARERDLANGGQSFFPTTGRSVSVRRKFIFEDAFEEISGMEADLKATIRVKFIDEHGIEEAGIDGGGVFKEFMYEVLKLGFSPFSYGLFKATPDGRLYPNPDAPIANENYKVQFEFLGRLLGKAVFDGVLVDIPLAQFFLSKILGQFNYPTDLGSLDPELYRNMKFLKNCPPDVVEDLGLNFTVANNAFGTSNEVELVRNGRNIAVTAANRIEYMHRVANYRMNTQIREQSETFLKGFSKIISPQYIRLFSHDELQLLISGKTGKIDLDDLRRHTKYSGGYNEETHVIKWFWEAMAELSAEDQSKLLQFVTSSPRAPLLGFSYLVPGFCIHRAEGDVRLPTASTCMNLLKLPQYKSLDVVRDKLRYALQSNAGFDLS